MMIRMTVVLASGSGRGAAQTVSGPSITVGGRPLPLAEHLRQAEDHAPAVRVSLAEVDLLVATFDRGWPAHVAGDARAARRIFRGPLGDGELGGHRADVRFWLAQNEAELGEVEAATRHLEALVSGHPSFLRAQEAQVQLRRLRREVGQPTTTQRGAGRPSLDLRERESRPAPETMRPLSGSVARGEGQLSVPTARLGGPS
ncbi:MAG: hypothetical protein CMN30_28845 [Sandaracinus sp.]|nr:hypothetical protein [Sandaracinus sp.]